MLKFPQAGGWGGILGINPKSEFRLRNQSNQTVSRLMHFVYVDAHHFYSKQKICCCANHFDSNVNADCAISSIDSPIAKVKSGYHRYFKLNQLALYGLLISPAWRAR